MPWTRSIRPRVIDALGKAAHPISARKRVRMVNDASAGASVRRIAGLKDALPILWDDAFVARTDLKLDRTTDS